MRPGQVRPTGDRSRHLSRRDSQKVAGGQRGPSAATGFRSTGRIRPGRGGRIAFLQIGGTDKADLSRPIRGASTIQRRSGGCARSSLTTGYLLQTPPACIGLTLLETRRACASPKMRAPAMRRRPDIREAAFRIHQNLTELPEAVTRL